MLRKKYQHVLLGRLLLIALLTNFTIICLGQFGGGEGTEGDPYQIASAEHLNNIRGDHLNAHFIQTANINLGEAPWNEGEGWEPIGDNVNGFEGTFDGSEFVITGLTINRDQNYQGLFGVPEEDAAVRNVTLSEVDIQGGRYTGAIAGRFNGDVISYCRASGIVRGSSDVGGLVGRNGGTIEDSRSDVEVHATGNHAGGIVGNCWRIVRRCKATGDVTAEGDKVGGAGGEKTNNQWEQVSAHGNITGRNEVGGYLGYARSSRHYDVYATGDVNGQDMVGGLVGNEDLPDNNTQQVRRGYSTGRVNGEARVGGLLGRNRYPHRGPQSSYWNMEASGQEVSEGGEGLTTAQMLQQDNFQGWDFNNVWRMDEGSYPYLAFEGDEAGDHNFPDIELLPPSGLAYVIRDAGETIRVTWEEPSLFAPEGYHIYRDDERLNVELLEVRHFDDTDVEEWTPYHYQVSAVYIVDNEPVETERSGRFWAIAHDLEGEGNEESPYAIANATQLATVGEHSGLWRSHFIQTVHIDISDMEWSPIGTSERAFGGSFNGNEFVITGLNIDTNSSYQGLFGMLMSATVENVTLEDVDVDAGGYAGALAGKGFNINISNCSAEGIVRANDRYAGGMFGRIQNGEIYDSRAYVEVEAQGQRDVGGFWGYNRDVNIWRSYATGDVTGGDYVGGFGGYEFRGIHYECFATGNVTGDDRVGGFVSRTGMQEYHNCYAMGDVTGNSNVGGFLGEGRNDLFNCYAMGRVTGDNNVGGLIGNQTQDGNIVSSYWDTETTGQAESDGGEGRATREMTHPYQPNTYVDWDFDDVWEEDPAYQNRGYPFLQWQDLEPIIVPDPPVVNVEIVTIEGEKHIRLSWQLVEDALSYMVYSSNDPYTDDWGEPVRVLDEEATEYAESVEESIKRYFHVTASSEEAP